MYRKTEDFIADWTASANGTVQVLESLTDEKLGQAIVEGHSTLGWIGWHLATSPAFFAGIAGLKVRPATDKTAENISAAEIVQAYKTIAENIAEAAKSLTDATLSETVNQFGKEMTKGSILGMLIQHQVHHRGQMTVLLRQAGLPVPAVLGPTKEMQAKG